MAAPHFDPREFLKHIALFSDFSHDELAMIARATTELHVARGETIFRRGDQCNGFHTVVYGQVKLAFVSAQGNEKIVEIVGKGGSFGEALMFMERPYILDAQALADCLLLHIGKDAIFAEIDRNATMARRMLASMSRRLHGLIADVESYSLRSGSQRVVGYLLKDEPGDGGTISLAVSKKLIASRLNLTPEYLSRVLHDMIGLGLIAMKGRDITILDVERLRAYEGDM